MEAAEEEVITVDKKYPDWNSPSILEQTATKTMPPEKKSFSFGGDIKLEEPSIDFCFKIAPNPFFEGSDCYIYHASDLVNFRKIVLKRFKKPELNTLEAYMKELEIRSLSNVYAQEFNEDKFKPEDLCSINFTHLDIILSAGGTYYMMEKFLTEKIESFNDKNGKVGNSSSHSDLLQAFSHYTWVKSAKTLLVCDIQGYKLPRRNKIVLTDPAIHSNGDGGKYGVTDDGMEGIERFFSAHSCSAVCQQMNLAE